jgi:hypothetical protein
MSLFNVVVRAHYFSLKLDFCVILVQNIKTFLSIVVRYFKPYTYNNNNNNNNKWGYCIQHVNKSTAHISLTQKIPYMALPGSAATASLPDIPAHFQLERTIGMESPLHRTHIHRKEIIIEVIFFVEIFNKFVVANINLQKLQPATRHVQHDGENEHIAQGAHGIQGMTRLLDSIEESSHAAGKDLVSMLEDLREKSKWVRGRFCLFFCIQLFYVNVYMQHCATTAYCLIDFHFYLI